MTSYRDTKPACAWSAREQRPVHLRSRSSPVPGGTLQTFQARATSKGDTVVGNDVWFGRDVTVMPGITIGNGAIIATASLVTRDVAPYTVVGGNPAALIKRRYSDAEVELLQRAAWWDWPTKIISAHASTLMAGTPADIATIADQHRG